MDQKSKTGPLVVNYLCYSCGHMNEIEIGKPLHCEPCDYKRLIRNKAFTEVLSILNDTGDILYNVHTLRQYITKELK